MWLFYLWDGTVIGTTSAYQIPYIRKEYREEIAVESYAENLDYVLSNVVDYVIE